MSGGAIIPSSVALRTSYTHHAADAGYKQILRFTQPAAVLGVDEHKSAEYSRWKLNYRFLFEWEVKRFVKGHPVDLVHILYGEEYYRFSGRLLKGVPLVVTYHQPGDVLLREITTGDYMGRVYGMAHRLSKSRFQKISAAIVMTQEQKDVLATAMPGERIHVIPLGANIGKLVEVGARLNLPRDSRALLTVGNWLRDWDFYFAFVKWCAEFRPDWRFTLINRRDQAEMERRSAGLGNLTYLPGAEDEVLYRQYTTAAVHFLPFTSTAGNNSLNEGLALGCPVVSNILHAGYADAEQFTARFSTGSLEAAAAACEKFLLATEEERAQAAAAAKRAAMSFDWSECASKTIEVYREAMRRNA
jgi:glycosyltransferase involved in cell wall biosynthesis